MAKVAMEILAGEIAATERNLDKAISHFESAVAFEDQLPYDEPTVWYIPTRQTLGFYLLKAKKYQKAESIYFQDLEYYRDNGWSLIGLHHSLIGQNKMNEAEMVKEKFEKVWELVDIEINSSIL
ncbi:tetratricopeptide repeat protein [Urechidicola sp. KH5]